MALGALFSFFYQQQAATPSRTNPFSFFIMMGLIFVVFYVLVIMPSRKKQKKHQENVAQLKSGDKIVTSGGIYGTVMGTQKDKIELKIASNVKIDVSRNAVAVILTPPTKEK
jgi:preprotein translocase subunit YajC